MRSSASWTIASEAESNADVASSRRMIVGFLTNALAIATRCNDRGMATLEYESEYCSNRSVFPDVPASGHQKAAFHWDRVNRSDECR